MASRVTTAGPGAGARSFSRSGTRARRPSGGRGLRFQTPRPVASITGRPSGGCVRPDASGSRYANHILRHGDARLVEIRPRDRVPLRNVHAGRDGSPCPRCARSRRKTETSRVLFLATGMAAGSPAFRHDLRSAPSFQPSRSSRAAALTSFLHRSTGGAGMGLRFRVRQTLCGALVAGNVLDTGASNGSGHRSPERHSVLLGHDLRSSEGCSPRAAACVRETRRGSGFAQSHRGHRLLPDSTIVRDRPRFGRGSASGEPVRRLRSNSRA